MTREEIAEALASRFEGRLADAVRALPVIATCGDCGWCHKGRRDACMHDRAHVELEIESRLAEPPSWCPLRGGGA